MDVLHNITDIAGKVLHNIWSYDLITVAGNHIRVSNIICAIMLFLAGIRYSKKFSAVVKYYVRTKLNSDKDAANALEKIIFYGALSLFIITILEIANVPLSTFAFVGGALAIGIGFGAQSLISNFIGSIIIMVERPLKIGDIIEIEGVIGTVNSVGARCVVLTTFSNVDVLVPNSKLMQNTLVNWTLNDSAVRYQVELNIPRKNDIIPEQFILEVEQILANLDVVLKNYKPRVNLTSIGPTNLGFILSFYCKLEHLHNLEHVKGVLNLALLKQIPSNEFVVDYLKVVNVKLNEKDDK
jgi:potassium efflux system protein